MAKIMLASLRGQKEYSPFIKMIDRDMTIHLGMIDWDKSLINTLAEDRLLHYVDGD